MTDSKGEVWYRGPVVQLIGEVDFGDLKDMVMSEERKSRIVVWKKKICVKISVRFAEYSDYNAVSLISHSQLATVLQIIG